MTLPLSSQANAPLLRYRDPAECPQAKLHMLGPPGYLEWHRWADRMKKTHRQCRCPGCGYFRVWERRDA